MDALQDAMFEGIAKTNTTNTSMSDGIKWFEFEGIAKTNTTNTGSSRSWSCSCLRVLLKQIQQTPH